MPPTRRRARQVPDPLERAQLQATLAHAATVLYTGARLSCTPALRVRVR